MPTIDRATGPRAIDSGMMNAAHPAVQPTSLMSLPRTAPGDPTIVLALLADDTTDVTDRAEDAKIAVTRVKQDKAMAEHTKAIRDEFEKEANKGQGFFASIGTLFKDVTRDLLTGRVDEMFKDMAVDTQKMADSKQFWQDLEQGALEVAKWGAVAASIVVAVATCGAAAPGAVAVTCAVVGASMSTAAAAESEGHFLQKAGVVDEKTDGWIVIAGSACGSCVSAVGGLAAGAQMATQAAKASHDLAKLGTAASEASALADVAGGAAHGVVAGFEASLARAQVGTKAAEVRKKMIDHMLKEMNSEAAATRKNGEAQRAQAFATINSYQAALDAAASWRA